MEKEKKIGTTMKQRTGDWVVTFEVIGYRNGHNVWQEKRRRYEPLPPLSDAIAAIEREKSLEYTKQLRRAVL